MNSKKEHLVIVAILSVLVTIPVQIIFFRGSLRNMAGLLNMLLSVVVAFIPAFVIGMFFEKFSALYGALRALRARQMRRHLFGALLSICIVLVFISMLSWRAIASNSVTLVGDGCDILEHTGVLYFRPWAERTVRCRLNAKASRKVVLYSRPLDGMYRLDVRSLDGRELQIYLRKELVQAYE